MRSGDSKEVERLRFSRDSTIRDVLQHENGAQLLWEHGYDAGEGFTDVLSQYVTLDDAERLGRLRQPDELLKKLNQS